MPLTPLKETAPAPSHDVAEPDSPTTSGQQNSMLQFELRYGLIHSCKGAVHCTRYEEHEVAFESAHTKV